MRLIGTSNQANCALCYLTIMQLKGMCATHGLVVSSKQNSFADGLIMLIELLTNFDKSTENISFNK